MCNNMMRSYVKKREDFARKPIAVKRKEVWIVVDGRIPSVADGLKELGYSNVVLCRQDAEPQTMHDMLNKMNLWPLVFVTRNRDDFLDLSFREYTMMWATRRYPITKMSAKIDAVIQRYGFHIDGDFNLSLPYNTY